MIAISAALRAAAVATVAIAAGPAMAATTATAVRQIVDAYAQDAVRTGKAVGIGVGVIVPGQKPLLYSFGVANTATEAPFTADTLVEIASDTKVFTTNLLGQAVASKQLTLATTLQQVSAQIGAVRPASRNVTLEELADFTSGFPDSAPLCGTAGVPGCLPAMRPTQSAYDAADFLTFFENAVPANYAVVPPAPLSTLPAPYLYSNFSVGLLGLILATPTGPIGNGSVGAWYNLVNAQILTPLGMTSTFLGVPASQQARRAAAAGYSPTTAEATIDDGRISAIRVTHLGKGYTDIPTAEITGGGGSGAKAYAIVQNGVVTYIVLAAQGENYQPAPSIAISSGGATSPARARAIVAGGQIVGFEVTDAGAGYTSTPTITTAGGRAASGRDAIAVAHIVNGRLAAITVSNGGAGYVTPVSVVVAPGGPEDNVVPEWAAAGGLVSSVRDMTSFAAAALGLPFAGTHKVPAAMANGFRIAETAYACARHNPDLATCPATNTRSGLAWSIQPADVNNGVPQIVSKGGGLTGFSSQIVLVPQRHFAVVVLVNSDSGGPALELAYQIAYGLLFAPP